MMKLVSLSALLLVSLASLFRRVEGQAFFDVFCGPEIPNYSEAGSQLEMTANIFLSQLNSTLRMAWSQISTDERLIEKASCSIDDCNSSIPGDVKMIQTDPSSWLSSIYFTSVPSNMAGLWMVTLYVNSRAVDEDSCLVLIKPKASEINCPSSLVGYPFELTAISNVFSFEFARLELYKGREPNRVLLANCTSECILIGDLAFGHATITLDDVYLKQSVFTLVGDISFNDEWTTIWYDNDNKTESISCVAVLDYADPTTDCLEPFVSPPPNWQLNGLVLVTLKCFTRKFDRIIVTGNYSSILQETQNYVPFSEVAQYKFKIIRKVDFPTTLEIKFNIVIERGPSIERSAMLHINSSSEMPQFSQPFYTTYLSEEMSKAFTFSLLIKNHLTGDFAEIINSFPVPDESNVFLTDSVKIYPNLFGTTLPPALQSLFEFNILVKVTRPRTNKASYAMVIFYPDSMRSRYPVTCVPRVNYQLTSNLTTVTSFPLPCTIYSRERLDITTLQLPKYLLVHDYQQNLQLEVENYFPVGIANDNTEIAVVDSQNKSNAYVPIIHITFDIERIPPKPVFLRAETTLHTAEVYVKVAPTVEMMSELITKDVILSFLLEIDLNGNVITSEKYATVSDNPNDLGQIVYNVTGLSHSTEYTGRVLTQGIDIDVASEDFSFKTQDGLPQPFILHHKSSAHSVEIHIMVASTIKLLSKLITNGVIKSFHLEILINGAIMTTEKDATISESPRDKGRIVYTVRGLTPVTKYTGRFTNVGSSTNLTTADLTFTTIIGLEIPYVRSSLPSIVAIGDILNFNCSSNEKGVNFQWYHNSVLLEQEDDNGLTLVASLNVSGDYQCQIIDNSGINSTSDNYYLTVMKPEDIAEFKTVEEITLQREWNPNLGDASSPEYSTMKLYLEKLIEFAMLKRPNFVMGRVISFRKGSIIAETEVVERVLNPGENTNIMSYLRTELESGIAESFQLNEVNLEMSGIELTAYNPQFIREGSSVEIHCRFVISHTVQPTFDLVWIYNQSIIGQERATTFSFEHKVSIFSKENGWLDLGSLSIYHYTYKLKIKQFPPRLIGTYRCQIEMKMSNLPSKVIDMDKSQSLNITYDQIQRQPKVLIHPPSFQIQGATTSITVYCNYTDADTIKLLNAMDKDIGSSSLLQPSTGVVEFNISPLLKSVKCLALSLGKMEVKSDQCRIHIIQIDDVICEPDRDRKSTLWEKTAAGTTSVKNCPPFYSGVVTRECSESGIWQESIYLNCIKEELETIKEEIKNVNDDGFEATTKQIKDISSAMNNSVTGPAPILSGEIVQIVNILNEVGKAVSGDDKEEEAADLVDSATLENFANAADAVLSTDESEWETITNAKSDGAGSGENSGVGSKLVVAMDLLATSSLSNETYSTEPIVNNNVAIKRDTFDKKDIVFPEEEEEKYDKHGGWVRKSANKVFLSATNFGDAKDKVQYAIVVFRGVDSKFVIDNDEQKKYSTSKGLRNKEIASDIMSFSLSLNPSSFSSPLKLQFQVTKENLTKPVCGFLDTSLGSKPVWSSKGCKTRQVEPDVVECKCSHLTNFAILMSPYGTSVEHHEVLSIITYVGCGISILCLVITIMMHAITWKYAKEDRAVLHVHLSIVLILAYITFLAGINQTGHDIACTVIAGLLHFLFLTVFFIMLAEGIQVLITVNFVFSKESHLWKLLLMAYICPLMVVGICLAITQTDGYRSSEFCWLNIDTGFLWGFVGPALFVILINFIIMLMTLRTMMTMVSMRAKKRKDKAKKAIRAILVLSPLFGITWVFGVFSVNGSLVVFQYLFAIFNCLQGFFVFLFYCLLCNQIKDGLRHMLRKYRSRSFGTEERMFVSSDNQNSEATSSPFKQSSSDNGHNISNEQTSKTGFPPVSKESGVMNPGFQGDGWKSKNPRSHTRSSENVPSDSSGKSGSSNTFFDPRFARPTIPAHGMASPQAQNNKRNRYPPKSSRDAHLKDNNGRRGGITNLGVLGDQGNGERRMSLPGMDPVKPTPYGAMNRRGVGMERFNERNDLPQGGSNESLW